MIMTPNDFDAKIMVQTRIMDVILQQQMYYMYVKISFELWNEIRYTYCENNIKAKFYMENNMVMSRIIFKNCIDVKPVKF